MPAQNVIRLEKQSRQIEIIQKRSCRLILGNRYEYYNTSFVDLNLAMLSDRREQNYFLNLARSSSTPSATSISFIVDHINTIEGLSMKPCLQDGAPDDDLSLWRHVQTNIYKLIGDLFTMYWNFKRKQVKQKLLYSFEISVLLKSDWVWVVFVNKMWKLLNVMVYYGNWPKYIKLNGTKKVEHSFHL